MGTQQPRTKLPSTVVEAARTVALRLLVAGRTRRELASEVDVHETNFGKFVAGKAGISPAVVVRLATLSGVDPGLCSTGGSWRPRASPGSQATKPHGLL